MPRYPFGLQGTFATVILYGFSRACEFHFDTTVWIRFCPQYVVSRFSRSDIMCQAQWHTVTTTVIFVASRLLKPKLESTRFFYFFSNHAILFLIELFFSTQQDEETKEFPKLFYLVLLIRCFCCFNSLTKRSFRKQ